MGIENMFTEPVVLKLRVIVYCALVFFSFFIFIGVAVMKDEAGGCPLYFPGPVSNCNFPLAIAVIFQLLYTLFRIVILVLLFLGKFTTDMFFFSNIMELVYFLVDAVTFLFTFIGACILSAGHNDTCDSYPGTCNSEWASASKAAQAGAWISTFLWLFIVIVGFMFLWRAGKLPFLAGGGGTAATGDAAPKSSGEAPPMDTPPAYPDDTPKY